MRCKALLKLQCLGLSAESSSVIGKSVAKEQRGCGDFEGLRNGES